MSRTSTPLRRSPSSSSDSSDATMLDAPTVPLTPARPRQPSLTTAAAAAAAAPPAAPDPSFSLLLSLPRELRDRVYTFALASPAPFWWPGNAPVAYSIAPALLRASKRIHVEAAPLLYTLNTFLFTHPSDCTVFRVVASPHAARITTVYFRIRERDIPLWTKYLGSKKQDRCLTADLPALKSLTIFLRVATAGIPRFVAHLAGPHFAPPPPLPPHVHAVHAALGHQVAALHHHVAQLAHAVGVAPPVVLPTGTPGTHIPPDQTAVPPPPPPFANLAPAATHHAPLPQGNHTILASFLRHERDTGIESLCLSLRDALDTRADAHAHAHGDTDKDTRGKHAPEVKIICIVRVPRADVARLLRLYPEELSLDRNGDARTRARRLHGVEICVEFGAVEGAG